MHSQTEVTSQQSVGFVYLMNVPEGGVLGGTIKVDPTWTKGGVETCRQTSKTTKIYNGPHKPTVMKYL